MNNSINVLQQIKKEAVLMEAAKAAISKGKAVGQKIVNALKGGKAEEVVTKVKSKKHIVGKRNPERGTVKPSLSKNIEERAQASAAKADKVVGETKNRVRGYKRKPKAEQAASGSTTASPKAEKVVEETKNRVRGYKRKPKADQAASGATTSNATKATTSNATKADASAGKVKDKKAKPVTESKETDSLFKVTGRDAAIGAGALAVGGGATYLGTRGN
jgi:hypothetical protein